MPNAEYPHICRWCQQPYPTYGALKRHVEGWHPVEHWDWLLQALSKEKELWQDSGNRAPL